MLAVRFDKDEAFEGGVRVCCSKVFVEGVLAADWITWLTPCEGGQLGGGVEVDMRVDYGDIGCGCRGHCDGLFLGVLNVVTNERVDGTFMDIAKTDIKTLWARLNLAIMRFVHPPRAEMHRARQPPAEAPHMFEKTRDSRTARLLLVISLVVSRY